MVAAGLIKSQSTAFCGWTYISVMDLTSLSVTLLLKPLFLDLKEPLTYYTVFDQGMLYIKSNITMGSQPWDSLVVTKILAMI